MHPLEAHLRAQSDDLGSWLVYGDWLQETGDPRGELVRLEHEQARSGGLAAEIDALVARHRDGWRGVIPAKAATRWLHGFVVGITVPFDGRAPATLAAILADPQARFVTSLHLRTSREHDDDELHVDPTAEPVPDLLDAIAALDLRRIHDLSVAYARLGDTKLRQLLTWQLGPLRSLDLRYNELRDRGVETIAGAPLVSGVRSLYLQRNEITGAGVRALADSPHLRALELLDLRHNPLGDARALAHVKTVYVDRGLVMLDRRPVERRDWQLDGLALSPEPTPRFTAKRFVDVRRLDPELASRIARPSAELPHTGVVYVDPVEWSFRTFENIVPLDHLFEGTELELSLDYTADLADDIHHGVLRVSPATRALLAKLDTLPLYVPPQNAVARGGLRYIFHSARLAEALTRAVRDALPLEHFSHVNPVFRCNRFEPEDDRFHRHVDTPYFDAARHHVSKYTLLVYLTGGRGEPALRFEDRALDAIEPFACIAMHQRHPHEGGPYVDGRKVFLRTELVFRDEAISHQPEIGQLFAKACYLTQESVQTPELAHDADGAYNRVAAAHWQGWRDAPSREPVVHKAYRGVHWLANGYDFWFPRSVPLADCATLTLLDHFNCKLAGVAFRSLCVTETLRDVDDVDAVVARFPAAEPLRVLDKHALFPPPEAPYTCCPGHSRAFDPTLSHDVIELYQRAQRFAEARILPAPILMLGQEVLLDPTRFVVEPGAIHVLSAQRLAPINFAACWNCRSEPLNYVDIAASVGVLQPLVPPILWEATRETHHLMFDFFRNTWMVEQRRYDVPVPQIRIVDPEEVDDGDEIWFIAAHNADPQRGLPELPMHGRTPWWAHYLRSNPVICEMWRKRDED